MQAKLHHGKPACSCRLPLSVHRSAPVKIAIPQRWQYLLHSVKNNEYGNSAWHDTPGQAADKKTHSLPEEAILDVGERLKLIRSRKGLSQRELAKRAGVTNSTISMIEKNSVSPSVGSLKKVLQGIPISLVEFFSGDAETNSSQPVVYRPEELIDLSVNNVSMKLVGKTYARRALAFMIETYEPGADTGSDLYTHDGEEAGLVISGRFELTVGTGVYELTTGDAYYFDSTRPHRFRNPFNEACQIVSATTPANF